MSMVGPMRRSFSARSGSQPPVKHDTDCQLTSAIAAPPRPAPQDAIPVDNPLLRKKYWLGIVYALCYCYQSQTYGAYTHHVAKTTGTAKYEAVKDQ